MFGTPRDSLDTTGADPSLIDESEANRDAFVGADPTRSLQRRNAFRTSSNVYLKSHPRFFFCYR
jgi:hypothetical protein